MSMFDNPALDARMQGVLFKDVPIGYSEQTYTFPFNCIYNGMILSSSVDSLGSFLTMETQYNAGPYGWKRYKKFVKEWQLMPNYVCKNVLFPTTPSAGVRMVLKVQNNSSNPIDIAMNLYQFVDKITIKPSQLEEGEDW